MKITTAQTLSVKLTKLKKYGLITSVPVSIKDNYANGYVLTDKGRKIIKVLETIK
ncbi:MAG: hypothetical protein KGQ83_08425 [Planctomycetes bacterium]|nr:hypothetical protein [Planctomycetota bacterium]